MSTRDLPSPATLTGIGASAGLALGTAVICHCGEPLAVPRRTISEAEAAAEMARFDAAVTATYSALLRVEAAVRAKSGAEQAGIFAAQRQMLHDPMLRQEVVSRCVGGRTNLEAAVADAIDSLAAAFAKINNPVFAERAADVRDVGRRLLTRLLARDEPSPDHLPPDSIIVARELLPSLAPLLPGVRGLIAEQGGATAHAVILARSLGIPTLLRVDGATHRIASGDPLVLDARAGRVVVRPSEEVRRDYLSMEAELNARQRADATLPRDPAVTLDDVAITLSANAGNVADCAAAAQVGAAAVGLYRTEFAFLGQTELPTEEDQYRSYRAAAEEVAPREIVFRLLDVGSDKRLPCLPLPVEPDPALGQRGTRLLLRHPQLLETQLRALLRVSATHKVALLFPMIGGLDEFRAARRAVEHAKVQLEALGISFAREFPVGAMIETPSAVILAGALAREADFLSVGSNDLVQYLLAADRTSSAMSEYYEPLHPAVLHALKQVVEGAADAGKRVSLCGEIAGDPAYTNLLIGLGLRSFSVAPRRLLEVKRAIRSLRVTDARRCAARALAAATPEDVKAALRT